MPHGTAVVKMLALGATGLIAAAGGFAITSVMSAGSPATYASDPGATNWPVNEQGESFGSNVEVMDPNDEPDLINARASNGREGFVRKSELERVDGSQVKNLDEALAWNKYLDEMLAKGETISVPVYESDGRTVIGEFFLDLTEGETSSPPPDVVTK